MVKNNNLSILIGYAGTGKTTTLKEILRWAQENNLSVIQAAPTGKAAKRMMESTGRNASTIHSALGCQFDGKGFFFQHNENHPFNTDLLIIDEMSMVTSSLFCDLLKAVDPKKTKILLIGDDGQLPSIGAGAVIRDLILSNQVPYIELDQIHRNSGKIVEACSAIRKGEKYISDKKLNTDADNPVNLIHVEVGTPEKILDAIEYFVSDRMVKREYNPVWDVQIISPVNIRGQLSCESVNKRLQKKLNINAQIDPSITAPILSLGDKVIQTKNDWKAINIDGEKSFVVNGDIGVIIDTDDPKNFTVRFFDPERDIKIPKTKHDLLHAYCITCHRFQGSEAKVIILPVHTSFSYFTTRRWLYTAVSRARDICITVGQFSAINQMISNPHEIERNTRLKEAIIESVNSNQEQEEWDI